HLWARSGRRRRVGQSPLEGSAPARRVAPRVRSSKLPLHVGDVLLVTGVGAFGKRSRDDGDEFPTVLTPVVQNLLGGMRQQRHGLVLPLAHRCYPLSKVFRSEEHTLNSSHVSISY